MQHTKFMLFSKFYLSIFFEILKGLRVLELAQALEADYSDILAICAILDLTATSRLSTLSFEDCKKITDYYEGKNKK